MYLIKQCPECGKPLRFPIDKGVIKVKCICGNSFFADPDKPDLYKNAQFDLSSKRNKIQFTTKLKYFILELPNISKKFWRFFINLSVKDIVFIVLAILAGLIIAWFIFL